MRCVFFSLLILLNAFRGLAVDAMAYEKTAGILKTSTVVSQSMGLFAINSISISAFFMPVTGQIRIDPSAYKSCHESVQATIAVSEPAMQTGASEHLCAVCPVCHSHLLECSPVATYLNELVAAPAPPQCFTWMSADLIQLQKPPVF